MTKAHTVCPHCGQRIKASRLGVRLPPIHTRMVDILVRAGRDGIARADLHEMIYSDRVTARQLLSVHINKINRALALRGEYRIHSTRGHYAVYSLRRIDGERAA